MSSNKKSGSRIRWIQIIFIILGAAAIIIELAYILKVVPQSAGSSNETSVVTQSTSEVKSDKTAGNNEDKENNDNNINKYVFVGDSRYVGMSAYKEDTDTFIAKNNMGYSYLEEQMSLIKQSCDKNTALIIGLGVNDLKYSREKYITTINSMADAMDCKIYYMLVNPVDEKKEVSYGYSVENNTINEFNKAMKAELTSDVHIIDTYSYLQSQGYVTVDGLHYDNDTYKLIYDYIKEAIKKDNKA